MTRQKTDFTIPSQFRHENETHKYLGRFKKSWEKRFRPGRMEELYEAVDIGNYLIALGREQDAIELLEYATKSIEFDGDYNIWCSAGAGIILLCRQYRLMNHPKKLRTALARIIKNDIQNGDKSAYFNECTSEHEENLKKADEETQKWGCHIISRSLMGLQYLRETGEKGFEHSGTYDLNLLDCLEKECYSLLRAKLK